MIRTWMYAAIMTVTLFMAGCGSEMTAGGAGLISGIAASKTMQGVEADLAAREQALIDRYNAAVEAGAKSEVLDALEKDINKTVQLQQGVAATKNILEAVSDPSGSAAGRYGPIAALIGSLALNFWQKREGSIMKKTTKAIVKGVEVSTNPKSNPENPVKAAIKTNLVAAGVYHQGDNLIRKLKIQR